MINATQKWKSVKDIYPDFLNSDFVVEEDDFKNIEIDRTQIEGFWYLKKNLRNSKNGKKNQTEYKGRNMFM